MSEPIRGKVAKVLTARELAMNIGSNHGVTIGMVFDVIDKFGSITDPDTNKTLGSVERVKVKVQVTQVQERFSLAATFSKKKVNVGGNFFDIGPISLSLMPAKWITRYDSLKKDDYRQLEKISEDNSFVKTGDIVLQVVDYDGSRTPIYLSDMRLEKSDSTE